MRAYTKTGEPELLSLDDVEVSQVIFRLLKHATSQQVVKDFLKKKNIASSAQNWDDLFTRRIQPALNDGVIAIGELRDLLREAEECGRQHTFLFRCAPERAIALISQQRVEGIAAEEGLSPLLTTPIDLELPDTSTIVDVRLDLSNGAQQPRALLIKVVETRTTKALLSETTDMVAGRMTKTYAVTKKRAVNIAQLNENGLLEFRLASQDNQSRYHDNLRALRIQVSKFIPLGGFEMVSLSKAKDRLLEDRATLAGEVRYSHSTASNDFGFSMQVSTSSQEENLSTDDGSMAALESFLANEGHVTGSNIYFKMPDTEPPREIHVLLSGEVNEFAVPVSCSTGDYMYVRGKILSLNH